ncbi:D-lyxose/D-mannose family sugar isomerase [Mucilaginibacter ximonensis]|uniref:D-lyxose ketol-isomerase n=1 Tax=Mucilaginibacter ximonensis TaxID=538021 RepID=A0ABW5YBC2_9SPHI
MKRSEINQAIVTSGAFFKRGGWTLPPHPRWDVTDFGLGDFKKYGLVLINLAEEAEYCEKLMYAAKGQTTPSHTHKKKKEDIICRTGELVIRLWANDPVHEVGQGVFQMKVNGGFRDFRSGDELHLRSGERVTIEPGIWHEFFPASDECIIGEVSTANDDVNDNFFSDPNIGRYAEIDEDEAPMVKLLSDK